MWRGRGGGRNWWFFKPVDKIIWLGAPKHKQTHKQANIRTYQKDRNLPPSLMTTVVQMNSWLPKLSILSFRLSFSYSVFLPLFLYILFSYKNWSKRYDVMKRKKILFQCPLSISYLSISPSIKMTAFFLSYERLSTTFTHSLSGHNV